MHFAYPPRKKSNPQPFRPRSTRLPLLRRSRIKALALLFLACLLLGYLVFGSRKPSPYHERVPSGSPSVVLVTIIDPTSYNNAYLNTIKENREQYGAKHGYAVMIAKAYDYDTHGAPQSWAKILAMRHALSKYPDCKYLWYLDQDAYIMDPSKKLEQIVMDPKKLESLMIKDYSVVPPDSIIKTFSHLNGKDADFVVSQDKDGLVHKSVVVRNGEWAKFFIEMWLDPLYRSYNFQKAERHALEHIVQWHPTVLSKLALIPQRTIAAYASPEQGDGYQEGDFVVMFADCSSGGAKSCETVSSHYLRKWKDAFGSK
ncbi:hypothetical protein CDD81_6294 [Ophiocordyceps australis]|uniref:Alpha-1,2-galactosyltransferase n=1 Tax=Ophiocordyceps australis TaxID=1399860 RepID=A0A2C5Y693_9HYPO|nr:hypothetical protein CDD81_6294 [Ophiocordyceps australis]